MKKHNTPKSSISIIIPCRNEENFIAGCLESIVNQRYPQNLIEIFVVDGQSIDKTKDIAERYCRQYPFIHVINNRGKTKPIALNLGIKQASGEYIAIIDAHAIYQNEYIVKCIETAIKYKADNVGGAMETITKNNSITTKCIMKCLTSPFGVGASSFRRKSDRIKKVDTVFGGCYKKDVFNKVGLFNEKLTRSQDIEFNIRLKKAGGKIILNPEIISYYYPKSTMKGFFKHSFLKGLWIIYVPKLTKISLRPRHYAPLALVLSTLIPLILSLLYPPFFWITIFILGIYLIANLYFSIETTIKEKNIKYLFLMPVVFVCRHFGHGLGSFWGIFAKPAQNKVYR